MRFIAACPCAVLHSLGNCLLGNGSSLLHGVGIWDLWRMCYGINFLGWRHLTDSWSDINIINPIITAHWPKHCWLSRRWILSNLAEMWRLTGTEFCRIADIWPGWISSVSAKYVDKLLANDRLSHCVCCFHCSIYCNDSFVLCCKSAKLANLQFSWFHTNCFIQHNWYYCFSVVYWNGTYNENDYDIVNW